MSVMIRFINHPRHGPVWYGCLFGTHRGSPYLIECRYTAKRNDLPLEDGSPPHSGIAQHITEQIAVRARRMGVTPEAYQEIDKVRKKTDVDIVNDALTRIGLGYERGKMENSHAREQQRIAQGFSDFMRSLVDPKKKS